jgi:hypothetical protein
MERFLNQGGLVRCRSYSKDRTRCRAGCGFRHQAAEMVVWTDGRRKQWTVEVVWNRNAICRLSLPL